MASFRHEELITLTERRLGGIWERRGFVKALGGAMAEYHGCVDSEDAQIVGDEWRAVFPRIPDSYSIDRRARRVRLIEVGHYSPHQMLDAITLWFYLDCEEWWLELTVVDKRSGAPSTICDDGFIDLYYSLLVRGGDPPDEMVREKFNGVLSESYVGGSDRYPDLPTVTIGVPL